MLLSHFSLLDLISTFCQPTWQARELGHKSLRIKWPMAIFLKKRMKFFGSFFWKNVKFLAIFWQSNGNFPEGQLETSVTNINTFYSCTAASWMCLIKLLTSEKSWQWYNSKVYYSSILMNIGILDLTIIK